MNLSKLYLPKHYEHTQQEIIKSAINGTNHFQISDFSVPKSKQIKHRNLRKLKHVQKSKTMEEAYLLIVDVEVDIEKVPESKQQAKLQNLRHFPFFFSFVSTFGNGCSGSFETIRVEGRGDRRDAGPGTKRRIRRGETPRSTR